MFDLTRIIDSIEDLEELEEMRQILKTVFRTLGDSLLDFVESMLSERAAKMYARFCKTLYDELINLGFSKEEAMTILLKSTDLIKILDRLSSSKSEDR